MKSAVRKSSIFILSMFLAVFINGFAYAKPMGNLHLTPKTVNYNASGNLLVRVILMNTGDTTLSNLHNFKLTVKDANGIVIANTIEFASGDFSNLVLRPGQSVPWEFEITGVKKADISHWAVSYDVDFSYATNTTLTDGIHVFVNNKELSSDVPPVVENDRTLVPMRAIFEALGAKVNYNDATKVVTVIKGDTIINHTIGSNELLTNGVVITLDVPSKLINDRTMVPLRAFAEALGGAVAYGQTDSVGVAVIDTFTFE